jgi:hypothetical protein
MEIFRTYPDGMQQPSVDEVDVMPYHETLNGKEKINVNCKSTWSFLGIIEALRANGYKLPERLNDIEKEVCLKLNVELAPSTFVRVVLCHSSGNRLSDSPNIILILIFQKQL